MISRRYSRFLFALLVGAIALVSLSSTGALARVTISPLGETNLPEAVAAIIPRVLAREGIDPGSVTTVSPTPGGPTAGVLVAVSTAGRDRAAVYGATGMTSFEDLGRVNELGGIMAFPSAVGLDSTVRETSMVGFVAAHVKRLVITLASGVTLEAELVEVGLTGYKAFAFSTDDASRFPVSYTGFDASGRVVKTENVQAALSAPCPHAACSTAAP